MSMQAKPKGPWIHRFSIRLFTFVLAVLIYWVLGFLVEDIESIQGPKYAMIEKQYLDLALLEKEKALASDIAAMDRAISNKREEMRIIGDGSLNLQRTINQLIELQKLSIEKSVPAAEAEQTNLSESLALFLDSQKRYQVHSVELAGLMDRKRALESERMTLQDQIELQRAPALEEHRRLQNRHSMRLAILQLLVLMPLLAVGVILIIKKRGSVYFPLFLGYGAAALIKVSLVIHEYFPSRYFKYILVIGLLVAVVKFLVYFIRVVAFPKAQWLTRQYREAYERFLCPVCEYPIRTGPRKFLFWTRRTVNKIVLPKETQESTLYTCPVCGTSLFEECPDCHAVRHALLPYCEHCRAQKEVVERNEESV